jgi:glycosyltransferase involved in cell wall biosynthesis
MPDPLVSIITPTRNRETFLPHAYASIRAQTWKNIEWLIDDDSAAPSPFVTGLSDGRIKYHHDPKPRSIGVKRNDLISRASGQFIACFDDDDYYAPEYLNHMIGGMRGNDADFIKLSAWFLYSAVNGLAAYWNQEMRLGLHFDWYGGNVTPTVLTPQNNSAFGELMIGFGFSYVFKREIWGAAKYPDASFGEDTRFLKAAVKPDRLICVADQMGICLHTLHGSNASRCWPQFLLPPFILDILFPGAKEYLSAIRAEKPSPAAK